MYTKRPRLLQEDANDIAQGKINSLQQNFELNDVSLSKSAIRTLLDHRWSIDADEEFSSELNNGLKRRDSPLVVFLTVIGFS